MSKPHPLSDLVPGLVRESLGKKSLLFGKMLSAWTDIAGPDVSAHAIPLDLKFSKSPDKKNQAVLHLAVESAYALEMSYQKTLLIERLNMFFGYAAIKDIKMMQQSALMSNKKPNAAPPRPLTISEERILDDLVGKIQENDLQTALKNLGKAILSRQSK